MYLMNKHNNNFHVLGRLTRRVLQFRVKQTKIYFNLSYF